MKPRNMIRKAHGSAAKGGAVLVVETPTLDGLRPLNAADTAAGLAIRKARGRPFQRGNAAAKNRKPSLAAMALPDVTDEDERRVRGQATSLRRHRMRELAVQHGGDVSSAVAVEVTAWSLATAYSRLFYDRGDPVKGSQLAERASGHNLKAMAIAEREAKPPPPPAWPWLSPAPPADASEPDGDDEEGGDVIDASEGNVAPARGHDDEDDEDEEPPMKEPFKPIARPTRPRRPDEGASGEISEAMKIAKASQRIETNTVAWDAATGRMVPKQAAQPAAPVPPVRRARIVADGPVAPPLPNGAKGPLNLVRDDATGVFSPARVSAPARPTAAGLAAMQAAGIDTSRWATE